VNDDIARIEALTALLREFDLDALKLRIGAATYDLVRNAPAPAVAPPVPLSDSSAVPLSDSPPAVPAGVEKVLAPINGIFYRSPSPGTPAFVDVGDEVRPGQLLCILEAMKMMNEITAETACIVRAILPKNGDLVARDEEMFWIEPL
jgi:acetyl-CoA carboxylase biotin carboxyl carrier protein